MNKKIIKSILFLIAVLFMGLFAVNAQDKTPNFDHNKGHGAYKRAKLYDSKTGANGLKPKAVGDKAADRVAHEFELLKDPNTGKIPDNIQAKEKEFSSKLPKGSLLKQLKSKNKNLATAKTQGPATWNARGPGNVGGRTRALALDLDDENIIFAGGVSGGLWRSTNGGAAWTRVTAPDQNPSITAIAQDTRTGFRNIWYYSSGEIIGNSANLPGGSGANIGALYQGTGIYKSTDSGITWTNINTTNDSSVINISYSDYIHDIAVNPTNGDLYFAALDGVYRIKENTDVVEYVFQARSSINSEIEISPLGKIYATASKEDGVDDMGNNININSRISVSSDGDTWTDITPDALTDTALFLGRIVVTIDPSNENFVWILVNNYEGNEFLLRYDVAAGTWADRSSGIPYNINLGNLEIQTGYNMVLKVHPSNSNIVFIGGVSLYRSSQGFTDTPSVNGWIGGYNRTNDGSYYDNHHPDLHNLVFLPSNPEIALSASDGGVHKTQDILDGMTVWTSLNNNYLTTQPYAVSLDPSATTDKLLAGFQDNGSWYSGSTNLQDPWFQQFSGDGAYNAIADNGNTLYVSSQFGKVYRMDYDTQSDSYSFTRVTPSDKISSGYFEFISPFILDHNNDNIMYMPKGGNMLVNVNLDKIPSGLNSTTDVNWFKVGGGTLGSPITAMDVSTYPVQHRLYYGANLGGFFRVDNAHLPGATRSGNLAANKGMGPGRINCVYVDPTDADRVFVTKSNYGVRSIWMSENAGNTWVDISGNLEENPDGTGNGPSVRWFTMIGNGDGYLAGTSTGLYYTETLNGTSTVWTREVLDIGTETIQDALVVQVKTRDDGYAAAATHGNGIFSANFTVNARQQTTLSAESIYDIEINNNVGSYTLEVASNFTSSTGSPITLTIDSNSNPSLCSINLVGNELQFTNIDPTKNEKVDIVIKGTSGLESTTMIVKVDIREVGIYNQILAKDISTPSYYDVITRTKGTCADDFIVPEGVTWNINRVFIFGLGVGNLGTVVNEWPGSDVIDAAVVDIYEDNNGKPGALVYTTGKITGLNMTSNDPALSTITRQFNLNIPFPEQELQPGKYWISAYPYIQSFPGYNGWKWDTTDTVNGDEAMFKNPSGFAMQWQNTISSNLKAKDWTPIPSIYKVGAADIPNGPQDMMFYIMGESKTLSTKDFELDNFNVYPNPNTGEFTIKFNSASSGETQVKIHDIRGRSIFNNTYNQIGEFNKTLNLNNVSAGIYILEVSDGLSKTTRKLIIE